MEKRSLFKKNLLLSRKLYQLNLRFLATLFEKFNRILFSAEIPNSAEIDDSVIFGHKGLGVVVSEDAVIKENVIVMHQVTIGKNLKSSVLRDGKTHYSPIIYNNVSIGVGAKILGPVEVGEYAIIGAGAVVIKDVPSYTIVSGVPASHNRSLSKIEAIELYHAWFNNL